MFCCWIQLNHMARVQVVHVASAVHIRFHSTIKCTAPPCVNLDSDGRLHPSLIGDPCTKIREKITTRLGDCNLHQTWEKKSIFVLRSTTAAFSRVSSLRFCCIVCQV